MRPVYGILSPAFLFAGVGVYLLFRDLSVLPVFRLFPLAASGENPAVTLPPSLFADILRFNVAGMLWLVSGILFFRFLWFGNTAMQNRYIAGFCIVAASLEIAQISPRVPGTFDPLDLLFMALGAAGEKLVHAGVAKKRPVKQ